MPLVRLQVRNEFGLGQPELYKQTNREDPKAVLDGVAVAGLVGILRQLGDLADFAAEVFHGLQEQVLTTASRSRKLMVRVQNIEASLPPLEKAVLAQTSHIHFAYTAGYEWHPRIKTARNHFIYNDLPQFIMDSYEECRDPPRLHVLDKFDTGGPGSCLRRYSDPTFFKRVSAYSDEAYSEKFERARKSRKSKKKRSSRRNRDISRGEQMHSSSGRMRFISPTVIGRSPSCTASTTDMARKSDLEDHSNSFDSGPGAGYIECVFHPSNSLQSDEHDYKELSPPRMTQKADTVQSVSPIIDDNFSLNSMEKRIASSPLGVTWDEKEEIVESKSNSFHRDKTPEVLAEAQDVDKQEEEVTPAEKEDMDLHEDVATQAGKQDVDMHKDEVTLSEKEDVDNHVDEAVSLTNRDPNDILFDEESNLKTGLSRVQTYDFDSEPDSYVDALNTIESESENDPDYETKREVEQFSSYIIHRNVENRTGEAASIAPEHDYETKQEVEQFSLDFTDGSPENRIVAAVSDVIDRDLPVVSRTVSGVSLVEEPVGDFPDSLHEIPSLMSEPHVCNPSLPDVPRDSDDSHGFGSRSSEQMPDVNQNSVLECSVGNGSPDNADAPDDTVVASIDESMLSNGSKSSDLLDKQADGINNNIIKPKGTVMDSAADHAVRFWTNGGLLGLEPSKPPVLTNSLTQASSITRKMDGGLNHNSMLKSNGHKEEEELSTEITDETQNGPSSRCFTSGHVNQACIPEKNSGSVLPVVLDSKANCTESNQGSGENSSRVFGFSHRLLINSFRQKVSFDENSGHDNSSKTGMLKQGEQNRIEDQSPPGTTFKTQASYGYPIDSLPPSPPLEHMKISFHPISDIETSKLRLKFPDGTNRHESTREMFPAFQLVPEASIHVHDSGSNSDDDDTFCRSSPYVSDDCRSLHSDYNSDQWGSDETPRSGDHRENESSHGISSTESALSSQQPKGMDDVDVNVANGHVLYTQNDVKPSLSGPMLDFPSFDTVNPVCEQESIKHSDCDNIAASQSGEEPAPPPPPLPPMQWRVSKPEFDIMNDMCNYISEVAQQNNYLNPSKSNFSQQARPSQVERENLSHGDHDDAVHKPKGKVDQKKLNGQEANLMGNGKEMDEREDFLHQIRTKSFNLRRTAAEKPNATTVPTANVKVTAILEKANAIRQVVASDDDDTWSDM